MKRRLKYTSAALLAVLALGISFPIRAAETDTGTNITNIVINNITEDTGLELGTDARARGQGSIATGKNSLAVGKNAVATGGNETQASINAKLNENKQRLQDISDAEANTNRLLADLQNIRKVEADVIEAGERVKQVRKAKQTAYERYQTAKQTHDDAVAGAADFLREAQAKIDDLNSRLTGVSQLTGVNISSDEGLTNAATQLKQMAEQGTTLDLSVDFYKDYVSSYYQALGDLRQNEISKSSIDYDKQYSQFTRNYGLVESVVNPYTRLGGLSQISSGINISSSSGIDLGSGYSTLEYKAFSKDTSLTNAPTMNIHVQSKERSAISDVQYNEAIKQAPLFKATFREYFSKTNDPFLTDEIKTKMYEIFDMKVDYYLKTNEFAYYQWKYEQTKDTIWLDKKANAIKESESIKNNFKLLDNPDNLRDNLSAQWIKENVTDIKDKNKVTTDTLTSELEKALGINKNAVQEKEAEIERLKKAMDQAKSTYDNTNPSAADLALSQRYEQIMAELTAKASELKSEQERLNALKSALTLHDLTNVGENAMAIGTNALTTGTNAMAIGTNAVAVGENSIAIGKDSAVTGNNSIAVGVGHIVIGNNSGTFGDPNTIYGDNSYAIGNNNTIGDANTPNTLGTNTFVLGSNVTTTANNAVVLGNGSTADADNVVSVGAAGSERKIIHVAAGDVSETSTDAVNGSQLYEAMQSAGQSYEGGHGITIDENNFIHDDILNVKYESDSNKIVLGKSEESVAAGAKKLRAVFYNTGVTDAAGTPDSLDVYIAEKGNVELIPEVYKPGYEFKGWSTTADGTNIVDLETFTTDTDVKLYAIYSEADENTGTSRYLSRYAGAAGTDSDPSADNASDFTASTTTRTKLTDSITISNLAAGEISATSTEAINGSQLYAVAKATSSDIDVPAWQEKLGDGKNAKGDTGLITGDTLYSAIDGVNTSITNKADINLTNITNDGKTIIRNLAKESVKVIDGTNTTVTIGADGDATTYAVNVTSDAIKGAIQADLDSKANRDATNLTTANKAAWKAALGDGVNAANDTGLITGNTLHLALNGINTDITNINNTLNQKADITLTNITNEGKTVIRNLAKESVKVVDGTNTTVTIGADGDATTYAVNVTSDAIKGAVQTDLDSKADRDASNLTTSDKDAWKAALGDGTNTAGDTGLITGDTLHQAITNVTNTTNTNLASKADRNAGNLTDEDVAAWQEKLGNGINEAGNTGLITGDTLNQAITNVTNTTNVNLSSKANINLTNITNDGKTIIRNLAKESVKVIDGTNTTVTIGTDSNTTTYAVNVSNDSIKSVVQPELDKKADKDAGNLTEQDVAAWQDKLGTGTIVEGNTGLVTGGSVYDAIKDFDGNGLVKTDGKVITIDNTGTATTIDVSHTVNGITEGRVLTGVLTDTSDATSVVNVGTLAGALDLYGNNVNRQISSLDRKLSKDIGKAGAAAAALAALKPLSYDPANKLNFAVGQGHYKGQNSTALGVFYMPNEDVQINFGGTVTGSDKAINGGISFRIGSGNKTKKVVKTSEFNALKEQNAAMAAQLADLSKRIDALQNQGLGIKLTPDKTPFPDVPANHWANNAIETLHGNAILTGYPDGYFHGDRAMTRYEYAQMLYKALQKGAYVDQDTLDEYAPELAQINMQNQ